MILEGLLALLWAIGGSVAAWPSGAWVWVPIPVAAAIWGMLARRMGWRFLLVPSRLEGYLALFIGWLGMFGYLVTLRGFQPSDFDLRAPALLWQNLRPCFFPMLAGAAAGFFVLETRAAIHHYFILMASVFAAVLGASLDPAARLLPLFLPFLVLLVICLTQVLRFAKLQRLREAARQGTLLAAQIPGFSGRTAGQVTAVAAVALTSALLTLIIFVAVPRVRFKRGDTAGSGKGASSTGITSNVTLESVRELKLDHRVALRMKQFIGGVATRPSLPMRLRTAGVDYFNGMTWSSGKGRRVTDGADRVDDGWVTLVAREPRDAVVQHFELEPMGLPFLPCRSEVARITGELVEVERNGGVVAPMGSLEKRYAYEVVSDVAGADPRLFDPTPSQSNARYVQLPGRDLQVETLARSVVEGERTAYRKAAKIEAFLRENFEYTLEFDAQEEPTRSFLFETRKGFCVHFASAMVVMLRHLDVPCRIAQGFAGGEWNDRENLVMFRLSDAHAWVEVWLGEMAGWVPFDPTAAQAFEMEDAADFVRGTPDEAAGGPASRRPGLASDQLSRLTLDGQAAWIAAAWNWIVDVFSSKWMKLAGLVFLTLVSFSITWRFLPRHERARLRAVFFGAGAESLDFWDEFLTLAARAGCRPERGETPLEFSRRLERAYAGATRVAHGLYAVRYGGRSAGEVEPQVRPVIDAIRAAQAGRKKENPS